MSPWYRTVFVLLAAAVVAVTADNTTCPGPTPQASPQTAPGVSYKLLLDRLTKPRSLVRDTKGNLLVAEAGRGVTRIVLNGAHDMNLCVKSASLVVKDATLNHGLAISPDGKTLLASSENDVFAYTYDAATGAAGPGRSIVTGMRQTGHRTRTILVPPANPDLLLVSRGSNGNIDKNASDVGSGRAQLRVFRLEDLLSGREAAQYTDGEVLGWGLRNSVGVAQDPTTGNIWTVENSIDDMHRMGDDIHESNPGEEMNFHGRPNRTALDWQTRSFGYPGCVAMFDTSKVKDYAAGTEVAAVGKPMGGDHMLGYTDKWCLENTTAPRITFGPHLAPLGVEFLADGSAALIAFHGSWKNPDGYRLSRVSFVGGSPVKGPEAADAEEMLMWNENNADCGGESKSNSKCFRPVGLALDEEGRAFMTSDTTGELFLVSGTQNKGVSTMATG